MRKALSEFLSKKYGSEVKRYYNINYGNTLVCPLSNYFYYREDLILSCGATHGLHMCLSSLLVPNGVIFVEEYTYMIALQVFREFPNFKIVESIYEISIYFNFKIHITNYIIQHIFLN